MPAPAPKKTPATETDGAVATAAPPQTMTGTKKRTKKTVQSVREIVYPRYETMIHCLPQADALTGEIVEYEGALTVELAKQILGWETEDEYVRREMIDDPEQRESKLRASDFLMKDRHGNKIRCRNNTLNRPFDERHARKIGQDILSHKYVMNGEDIIIGVTGLVLSGQHRLVGLILAGEEYELQQHWQDRWECEPFIETLIFVGADESQATLQTFDNVKPRALSDTIYTSPLFANKNATDKKRCSVMVDQGVDWLWRRLDATSNKFIEYQTHSASLDFLDRHKKLVASVKHIYDIDGDDEGLALSNMGLNAGRCAAMLYLMGCSGTTEPDAEEYHSLGSPKKESQLHWGNWEKALQFWTEIAVGRETKRKDEKGKVIVVRPEWVGVLQQALLNMNNEDLTGRVTDMEKCAVVALAWAEYGNGNEEFVIGDIVPDTEVNTNNNIRYLVDGGPTFGGADKGPGKKDKEIDPTPEELEAAKEEERKKRAAELEARTKGVAKKGKTTQITADATKKVVPNPTEKAEGTLTGNGDNEFSLADEEALTKHMNEETIAKGKAARKEARAAKAKK